MQITNIQQESSKKINIGINNIVPPVYWNQITFQSTTQTS